MKIEYKFVDGEKATIEVYGEFEEIMLELKNESKNLERRETRRHESLNAFDKDIKNTDLSTDINGTVLKNLDKDKLYGAIATLNPSEQKIISAVFLQKHPITYSEYAKQLGIKESNLYQKLWRIKCKLKSLLNK